MLGRLRLDSIGGVSGYLANRDVRGWGDLVGALFQASQRSIEARRVALVVALGCASISLGACASTSPGLTSHFVRPGQPSVDLGGPPLAKAKKPSTDADDARLPAIREVRRSSGTASSVETVDIPLRAALSAAALTPSIATYLEVAEQYRRLGIFDRAFDQLQLSARLQPNNAAVNDAVARTWRDAGMPGIGLAHAYQATYAAPRSSTARHTLGTLLYALGKRADAERAFREAVALDPSAWYAWQNLCHLAMVGGRTQEAIDLCHHAADVRERAKASHQ